MCVQTLYGHSGTVTSIFVYGEHILSCSTDTTVRAWKRAEGREHLRYPWFDLQVWGGRMRAGRESVGTWSGGSRGVSKGQGTKCVFCGSTCTAVETGERSIDLWRCGSPSLTCTA